MKITLDMPEADLETVTELIENQIMDLEDNGNDGDPEAKILREFLKKLRLK